MITRKEKLKSVLFGAALMALFLLTGCAGKADPRRINAERGAVDRVLNYAKNQRLIHHAKDEALREAQNNDINFRIEVGLNSVVAKAESDKTITARQIADEIKRQYDVRDMKRADVELQLRKIQEIQKFSEKDLHDALELIDAGLKYDEESGVDFAKLAKDALSPPKPAK